MRSSSASARAESALISAERRRDTDAWVRGSVWPSKISCEKLSPSEYSFFWPNGSVSVPPPGPAGILMLPNWLRRVRM